MKAYHIYSDWDFEGANLCGNSGVYLTKEKAIEVLNKGTDWNKVGRVMKESLSCFKDLEDEDLAEINEIEIPDL